MRCAIRHTGGGSRPFWFTRALAALSVAMLGLTLPRSPVFALSPIPLPTRSMAGAAPAEPKAAEDRTTGVPVEGEDKAPGEKLEFPYIPGIPKTPEPSDAAAERAASKRDLLTPRGTLVLEPSFHYAHWSENQIAIDGYVPPLRVSADISDRDSDVFVTALSLRYGITDRLELDAKVPWVWRQDDTTGRPTDDPADGRKSENVSGNGVGDVEFGAHYQINEGGGRWPVFVAGLRLIAPTGEDQFDIDTDRDSGLLEDVPTGSGFWALHPSATAVYQAKRASYHGSFSYTWYIEDDVGGDRGDVDPGDVIDLSVDAVFHVFEKIPFGVGYEHTIVGKTEEGGNVVDGADTLQIGILKAGAAYRFLEHMSCRLTVGVGVTDDAPDVEVFFDVPISITLIP